MLLLYLKKFHLILLISPSTTKRSKTVRFNVKSSMSVRRIAGIIMKSFLIWSFEVMDCEKHQLVRFFKFHLTIIISCSIHFSIIITLPFIYIKTFEIVGRDAVFTINFKQLLQEKISIRIIDPRGSVVAHREAEIQTGISR